MKILVTGAAGFIGSHLCERLIAEGKDVVGLDNFDPFYDPAMKKRNLTESLQSKRFAFVEGDIRDSACVEEIAESGQIECIIHLAAKAGVRQSSCTHPKSIDSSQRSARWIHLLDEPRRHD